MSVLYHPGKASVLADGFSQMTMCSVSHVEDQKKELVKHVHMSSHLGVQLEDSPNGDFMAHHNSDSSLVVKVKTKKHLNPLLMELK